MTQSYHKISKIIHWLMAVIIIGNLACGIYMSEFIDGNDPIRGVFYNYHKSFGVIIILLIIIRIINRFINKPPALPLTIKKTERIAAHIGHYSLYILMVLVPISGYLMSNSYGYKVKLFEITMPNLASKDYTMGSLYGSLHHYFGYLMLAIILLHITGALKHRYFDKNPENDVLKRMI